MSKIKSHIKQYSSLIFWLVSDLYIHYRWKLIWVIIATFVGLSMQTGAVYLCYRYAKALENNASFSWLEWEFLPRSSFLILLTIASIVMMMTIISAILIMKGRMVGLRLARDYTDYCSARIYVLVSSVSVFPNLNNGEIVNSRLISKMSRKDSLYAGMVVRLLTFSLIHIGTVFVAACSLFIIDASLTVIVIFILAIAAIFFYKKSIKAAASRILLGKFAPGMSGENKILNDRVSYGTIPLNHSDIGVNEIFKKGISHKFSQAYVNQRLVLEESNLLAQIVIGISMFLIILIQGNATIGQESNWSALLIYLVAFSLFATSFAKTAKMLTSINRFYPSINSYSKFVTAISKQLKYEENNSNKNKIQTILFMAIKEKPVELRQGNLIAYITPSSIDKYQLSTLLKALYILNNGKKIAYFRKPWLVSAGHSILKTSIREALLFPESLSISDIKSDIARLTIDMKLDGIPADLDKILYEKDIDKIDSKLLLILLFVSGKHNDNDIVIIDEAGLRLFSEELRENIFHYLSEKIIIISFSANVTDYLGQYGENIALFSDAEKIIGSVDLQKVDENKINQYLQEIKSNIHLKVAENVMLDEDY